MVSPSKLSNDFDALHALRHSYENYLIIKNYTKDIGLSSGLKKAFPLDSCVVSQDIVKTSLCALRTIGFIKYHPSRQVIQNSGMRYLMAPTFTNKDVLLL